MVRRGRRWILLKQIHHDLHRFLELRVVSLAQRLRIQFHLDIRRDAVVLHVPGAIGIIESQIRRSGKAAIEEIAGLV